MSYLSTLKESNSFEVLIFFSFYYQHTPPNQHNSPANDIDISFNLSLAIVLSTKRGLFFRYDHYRSEYVSALNDLDSSAIN